MKKNTVKLAVVGAAALALGIGVVALSRQPLAGVTPVVGAETSYTLMLSKNKGGKPTLSGGAGTSSVNTANGNPIAFSFTGCADNDAGLVSFTAGGTMKNDTRLSTIKEVTATFSGSGSLDLYTSFDGTSFVKKGTLTSGTAISSFTYRPNYVKLVASGAVSLSTLRLDYLCGATQLANFSSVKGQYKGVLTDTIDDTDHTRSDTIITVDDATDKVTFYSYDADADSWTAIDLYGLPDEDAYNVDYALASDKNASDPAIVYSANFASPTTITASFSDGAGTYHNYSFNGSKYVPVTSLSFKEGTSGTITAGDTFTLNANALPYGYTDTVKWATSNSSIVKFANSTIKTGPKVSFKGLAAGSATITATAGSVSATYAVTVKAAAAVPSALLGTTWAEPTSGYEVTAAFDASGVLTLSDNIGDEGTLKAASVTTSGTVSTIVYGEDSDRYFTGITALYDSSSSALSFAANSKDAMQDIDLSTCAFVNQ